MTIAGELSEGGTNGSSSLSSSEHGPTTGDDPHSSGVSSSLNSPLLSLHPTPQEEAKTAAEKAHAELVQKILKYHEEQEAKKFRFRDPFPNHYHNYHLQDFEDEGTTDSDLFDNPSSSSSSSGFSSGSQRGDSFPYQCTASGIATPMPSPMRFWKVIRIDNGRQSFRGRARLGRGGRILFDRFSLYSPPSPPPLPPPPSPPPVSSFVPIPIPTSNPVSLVSDSGLASSSSQSEETTQDHPMGLPSSSSSSSLAQPTPTPTPAASSENNTSMTDDLPSSSSSSFDQSIDLAQGGSGSGSQTSSQTTTTATVSGVQVAVTSLMPLVTAMLPPGSLSFSEADQDLQGPFYDPSSTATSPSVIQETSSLVQDLFFSRSQPSATPVN